MYLSDTIVAPATPPGQGAVAIIRLSGPQAIEIAHKFWHPLTAAPGSLSAGREQTLDVDLRASQKNPRGASQIQGTQRRRRRENRRLYLGDIRDPATGAAIDRALCVLMPGPRSLTGEDVAELHCHGGVYLVHRVVALAIAAGARLAEPGEFSRRAFLNGRIDLTAAEAIADLVAARGESSLKIAIEQLSGALQIRVTGLRDQVIAIRAQLEAEIDFADEDLALPSRDQIVRDVSRLVDDLTLLHDSFARGHLMRQGARAAIIGKPNAGKSSVLNLLLGTDRAIVTPIPGTTRDVIEDSVQFGPWPVVLQDTAGLREGGDEVERIGIDRTHRSASEADLLIAVFDSSRPFAPEDADVIEIVRGRPGVAILNKRDLPQRLGTKELAGRGLTLPLLNFSAITTAGLAELRGQVERQIEALAGETRSDSGVVLSRERHRAAVAGAVDALGAARRSVDSAMPPEIVAVDIALAAEALASITGEVSTEDVLDAVFREFCIGK
jgi:tRNA modification GTPase